MMSKWIKTKFGRYINSSHIRQFWIKEDSQINTWDIMVGLDLFLNMDRYEAKEATYTVEVLSSKEEATDVLAEIIKGLEREGE